MKLELTAAQKKFCLGTRLYFSNPERRLKEDGQTNISSSRDDGADAGNCSGISTEKDSGLGGASAQKKT
jgi:hypothetical protein